jgi:hypothetical protein
MPKGFWSFGLIAGSSFDTSVAPSTFTLMSAYPLSDKLQLSGSMSSANHDTALSQQSADITVLYQVLRASPWGSMVSASWMQGLAPRESRNNALATSGTVTYQLKQGEWYLFTTQLLRYHFTGNEGNFQATTSSLGGRQFGNKIWVNLGVSLFDFSSNARATKTLLDPQPLYVNCVWAVTPSSDITGSVGTMSFPAKKETLSMSLGVNIRTSV